MHAMSKLVTRLLLAALLAALAACGGGGGGGGAPAGAESNRSYTVNTLVDAVDANPGNGVCEATAGTGDCTLRAAIQESNADGKSNTVQEIGRAHV